MHILKILIIAIDESHSLALIIQYKEEDTLSFKIHSFHQLQTSQVVRKMHILRSWYVARDKSLIWL